jgi:hypothetical protein
MYLNLITNDPSEDERIQELRSLGRVELERIASEYTAASEIQHMTDDELIINILDCE